MLNRDWKFFFGNSMYFYPRKPKMRSFLLSEVSFGSYREITIKSLISRCYRICCLINFILRFFCSESETLLVVKIWGSENFMFRFKWFRIGSYLWNLEISNIYLSRVLSHGVFSINSDNLGVFFFANFEGLLVYLYKIRRLLNSGRAFNPEILPASQL